MPGMESNPESDPENDRQRRMAALQRLAQRDPASQEAQKEAPAATSGSKALPTTAEGEWRRSRRRWLIPLVAGVLIVALAAVAVARFALGPRASGAGATKALTAHVIMLPASAHVYCPSMPAWSPDGKYIAVMAQTVAPGGDGWCLPYADLVSDTTAQGLVSGYNFNSFGWATTVLVLDATSGALVRRLNPMDPTSLLCKGISDCGSTPIEPTSLSWSPDGANVLMFTPLNVQYQGPSGQSFGQQRGALDIMRADGTGKPRALMGYGRSTIITNDNLAVNLYSPSLFAWNITTGAASYTDIHEAAGVETTDYAPAFQIGPTGQLKPLTTPAAGAVTPWSYGMLSARGGINISQPNVLFQSSQWAWSADGRYVVPNVDATAYMNVAKVTSNPGPQMQGFYTPSFVAPPDKAAAAVIREVAPLKAATYVARDPHGSRLASFMCEQDGDTGKLTLRATASGKTLVTAEYAFPQISSSMGCPGDAEAIDWSPDGSHIAMTDIQDNQIVLWQVPAGA